MIVAFDNARLVPAAWQGAPGAAVHTFNPGLLADGEGWLLAYRVVAEPELERRIALCRLDHRLQIIPGSAVPFTDWVRFSRNATFPSTQATSWFADPRLYRLAGRTYIYWNSGWHEPRNHQFLQEIDATSLRPIGAPRELTLSSPRQKLEKNWALFECEKEVYAVYSVDPYRVIRVDLAGEGSLQGEELTPAWPNAHGYARVHGGLRGGAPPQRLGDHFYAFCHSIEDDPTGYRYVVGAYRFAANPPFRPTDMPRTPLALTVPAHARRQWPKLNPAVSDVLYPAGAAYRDGNWLISLGVDDERCAIAIVPHDEVLHTFTPVG